ncbi:Carboxylesterase [Bertholletia excelsa]
MQSAFSTLYHNHLISLVEETNAVAVSVEYRLAPEHHVPACYDDVWTALQWVAQHATGQGPDPWLNDLAAFERVFLVGDSAGANIGHNIAIRVGLEGLGSALKLEGLVLVHPFFGNEEPNKLWTYICPGTSGIHDPRLNPAADPGLLSKLGCSRVIVFVGEKDHLRERGWTYCNALSKSGWVGSVEVEEAEGEGHVFHLFNPGCEKARNLIKRLASFMRH